MELSVGTKKHGGLIAGLPRWQAIEPSGELRST
jgi:hypothetical protein